MSKKKANAFVEYLIEMRGGYHQPAPQTPYFIEGHVSACLMWRRNRRCALLGENTFINYPCSSCSLKVKEMAMAA